MSRPIGHEIVSLEESLQKNANIPQGRITHDETEADQPHAFAPQ